MVNAPLPFCDVETIRPHRTIEPSKSYGRSAWERGHRAGIMWYLLASWGAVESRRTRRRVRLKSMSRHCCSVLGKNDEMIGVELSKAALHASGRTDRGPSLSVVTARDTPERFANRRRKNGPASEMWHDWWT
jgi:hypothetical protein